jgi:LmbE family N-acetylglucosaminyl deacetylase
VLTLELGLRPDRAGPLRVLALGAHPDDIEIGCAGTILRLVTEHPGSEFRWVVFCGGAGSRAAEARASASALVDGSASIAIDVHDFRDGHYPYLGSPIKDVFEAVKADFEPDLILTHRREDLHQDHRLLAEVTWQTFRDHLILEYEVPKYEGDLGAANVYVGLSEPIGRRKVDHLLQAFPSQHGRRWFSADTFWASLRLRGIEAGTNASLAEAFTCRKFILS